jgi:hypothetical protein
MKQKKTRPLLFRISNRIVFFLFLYLLLLLLFYVIGNFRHFLDSHLLLLLKLSIVTAIVLAFFSLFAMIQSLVFLILYRRAYFVIYLLIYLFIFCSAGVLLFASDIIKYLASGM